MHLGNFGSEAEKGRNPWVLDRLGEDGAEDILKVCVRLLGSTDRLRRHRLNSVHCSRDSPTVGGLMLR